MEKKQVRFITLGCRVNQYETQGMRERLEQAGYENAGPGGRGSFEDIQVVVINTCTVTEEADRENRYWIRRARREHPQAKIVVTGCGVERGGASIASLPEVDLILPNREKAAVAQWIEKGCGSPDPEDERAARDVFMQKEPGSFLLKRSLAPFSRTLYSPLRISRSEGHTRAWVKIQDGCNHACSFCKVVLVRGRSRSRGLQDIVEEIKRLRDAGYRDIVFAGIQLGAYGEDLPLTPTLSPEGRGKGEGISLVDILEAAAQIEGIERLRLSSIEPTDVKPELISALKHIKKCAPHLHIPLQSGDDDVLKRMNRRYGRSFYLDLIQRLKSELPDFCLTLDVMAGFPGEEEMHFENTLALLREVAPLRCHVFPYSPREGTRAARWSQVEASMIRRRVNEITALSETLGAGVRQSFLGRVLPVLVERSEPGNAQGLAPNSMRVVLSGQTLPPGQIVNAELLSVSGESVLGRIHMPELSYV